MTYPRERQSVAVFFLLSLLLGATIGSGCYKPNIKDKGLFCSDAGACPEGFSCVSGRCQKVGSDAAAPDVKLDMTTDISTDTHGDSISDRVEASDVCVPRTGAAACTPQSDLNCDPVCQTKCCTTQKCSALNSSPSAGGPADFGCVPNSPMRLLGERCDPNGAGTPGRYDNCEPGLVCVEGNGRFCLQLCRGDADCPGTKCETRPLEATAGSVTASVCGLTKTPCDPTSAAAGAGCATGLTCYLTAMDKTNGDTTICEISSGDLRNTSCRYSRDCLPGYTCPTVGPGVGICVPVCSHKATPANVCPSGTTCQQFGQDYDYCS